MITCSLEQDFPHTNEYVKSRLLDLQGQQRIAVLRSFEVIYVVFYGAEQPRIPGTV